MRGARADFDKWTSRAIGMLVGVIIAMGGLLMNECRKGERISEKIHVERLKTKAQRPDTQVVMEWLTRLPMVGIRVKKTKEGRRG